MPSWKSSFGSPSLPMPMLPVATPLTAAVVVVEHLGGGEAGEDLDAQRFGLLRQPPDDVREADDVVAIVVEVCRQQPVGRAYAFGSGEQEQAVVA